MIVSAIGPNVPFKHDEAQKPSQMQALRRNNVALSGGLALAFLGTTAVTGIAHARVPHMVSSVLAIGAALFHVESLAVKNNKKQDYYA